MPTKSIVGSAALESVGYNATFNLPGNQLLLSFAPVYKTGGQALVTSVDLLIISPSGKVIYNTPNAFQFGNSIATSIPAFGAAYEWGLFRFRLTVHVTGASDIVFEHQFDLCAPHHPDRKNGLIDIRLESSCDFNAGAGYIRAFGGNVPIYKSKTASTVVTSYTFFPPAASTAPPVATNSLPAQFALYTGLSEIKGTTTGTFVDDGYTVIIAYEGREKIYVQCSFPCFLWCAYEALIEQTEDATCGTRQHDVLWEKLQQVNMYMPAVLLGLKCGKNVDPYLEKLANILNVEEYPCSDAETIPISFPVGVTHPASTTTTVEVPIGVTENTTTVAPTTTTTTVAPTTTTTTEPCAEITDIQGSFV